MTKKYTAIAKRLKELRGNRSQGGFAKEIGVALRAYQYYESGDRVPDTDRLTRIANLCKTTTDWILTGVEPWLRNLNDMEGELRKLSVSRKVDPYLLAWLKETGVIEAYPNVQTAPQTTTRKGLTVIDQGVLDEENNQIDEINKKILLLLNSMPVEDRREILKSLEEKKLLRELLEERKKRNSTY